MSTSLLRRCLLCCPEDSFIPSVPSFYIVHVYALIYDLSFWLTLFCIIGSRFIHLISTDSDAFFLRLSNIPPYTYGPLFYPVICKWIPRLLPCPSLLHSVGMNMGVHVSSSGMVSSGYMPSSGAAASYGSFVLVLKDSPHFSIVAVSIHLPTSSARGSLFPHRLEHLLFVDFLMIAILTSVVILLCSFFFFLLCSFDFHFY